MAVRIVQGDVFDMLPTLEPGSVQLCLTSPPYAFLRSYLPADHLDKHREIGSEPTPAAFVETMVRVFRDVKRVLRDDGVLVLNLGDSMSGSGKGLSASLNKNNPHAHEAGPTRVVGIAPKNLLMIPFRVAIALQADGWILRSVVPWVKRNPIPESARDRPTTAIEYLFLFAKRGTYYWDSEAVRQAGAEPKRQRWEPIGGKNGHTVCHGQQGMMGASASRAYRNSDAFFATWQGLMLDEDGDPLALVVNPSALKEAHFASFPAKLVEPFVKAATSAKGCCPACGAPWVRITEKTPMEIRRTDWGERAGNRTAPSGTMVQAPSSRTLGWEQGCSCPPAPPRPCVVLDPFFGSGTTGLVASRLGRDCIGIELNAQYVKLAQARMQRDAGPMFADDITASTPEQIGLFDTEAAG